MPEKSLLGLAAVAVFAVICCRQLPAYGIRKRRRLEELVAFKGGHLIVRDADSCDLPQVLHLLADDQLGLTRETVSEPPDDCYLQALEAIDNSPNDHLVVVVRKDAPRTVLAFLQLTLIPGIARKGSWRAQLESLRVSAQERGSGIGGAMVNWAIDYARHHGCSLVQLTTDKSRPDAHRFYERTGFVATHEGYKLKL